MASDTSRAARQLTPDDPAATAASFDPPSPRSHQQRQGFKSWRKKYYKMRHQFNDLMKQNQARFYEEQKAMRTARRLQEQNDQLLELLYDINHSPRIDMRLRYDIHSPTPSLSAVPGLEDDFELESAFPTNPALSLTQLSHVPHSALSDIPDDLESRRDLDEFIDDQMTGYLSPAHEEDYLAAIDAHEPISYNASTNTLHTPGGPWSARDTTVAALQNPVSVYNWLKKHQPEALDGHHEKETRTVAPSKEEKPAARAVPTKVMPKRASAGNIRHEAEVLDDDGTVMGNAAQETSSTATARAKRRAVEDDGAYRPKGGSGRKKKKLSMGERSAFPATPSRSEPELRSES